jgi:hypothetical protein
MTNSNLPDYRSLYSQFNSISKLTVEFYHSSLLSSTDLLVGVPHGVVRLFFLQEHIDQGIQ